MLALSGGGRTVELLVRRDTMHNRSILTKVCECECEREIKKERERESERLKIEREQFLAAKCSTINHSEFVWAS